MHLGRYLILAVTIAAVASAHGAKPIAPKKALAMIRAGYATATSATVTALQNTVRTYGGATLAYSGSNSVTQSNTVLTASTASAGLLASENIYTGLTKVGAGYVTLNSPASSGSTSSSVAGISVNHGTITQSGSNLGISGTLIIGGAGTSGATGSSQSASGATLITGGTVGGITNPGGLILLGGGGVNLNQSTQTTSGLTTVNSGTLTLGTGGVDLTNATIGQTGSVTTTSGNVIRYIIGLSNGGTQTLGADATLTIGGAGYVTSISPLQSSTSN